MSHDRKKMLDVLKQALELSPDVFYFANSSITPLPSFGSIHGFNRLLLPLEGEKRMSFFCDKVFNDKNFTPKEVLLCNGGEWMCEHWDTKHSMLSIVFFKSCIRVLFIESDGVTPPNGPDYFFHTSNPLQNSTVFMSNALFEKFQSKRAQKLIFMALIEELIILLENENDQVFDKEELYVFQIQEYLERHVNMNIGREDVADAIGISGSYVTMLLRKHKKIGFSSFLVQIRMNLAMNLLIYSNMDIKDIATTCGFSYPSYFIKLFRKIYKVTPAQYRAEATYANLEI